MWRRGCGVLVAVVSAVCGVAAPVLDADGVARFAIGIQGPSVRLTDSRMAELGPLLVQFPFPAWATRPSEAAATSDPFARFDRGG